MQPRGNKGEGAAHKEETQRNKTSTRLLLSPDRRQELAPAGRPTRLQNETMIKKTRLHVWWCPIPALCSLDLQAIIASSPPRGCTQLSGPTSTNNKANSGMICPGALEQSQPSRTAADRRRRRARQGPTRMHHRQHGHSCLVSSPDGQDIRSVPSNLFQLLV